MLETCVVNLQLSLTPDGHFGAQRTIHTFLTNLQPELVYRELITVYNTQISAEFRPVSRMREIPFEEYILMKGKNRTTLFDRFQEDSGFKKIQFRRFSNPGSEGQSGHKSMI